MSDIFSAYEVVEFGVEIEKNGRDFYEKIAAKTTDAKVKNVVEFLAEEEKKHITVFENLLSSVHEFEPRGAYPEEYFAYIKELASRHIFTQKNKGAETAKAAKTDIGAVELGIRFEEESIVFYEEMKKAVPAAEHNILDELIKQEKEHLEKLLELERELKVTPID